MDQQVDEQVRRQRRWPKEANYLSRQLRRLMTDLRAAGWAEVTIAARTGTGGRQITIRKVAGTNGSTQPAENGSGAQVSTPGVGQG